MLWQLFRTFFLIGSFTFGGGVAMIPIIEKEVVDKQHWLTSEEFLDALAITQSAPGVLAVNMSTYIGYRLRGLPGALISALGAILPSFLIITGIAMFFTSARDIPFVERLFRGIRPAVAALIGTAVYNLVRKHPMTPLRAFVIAGTAVAVAIFRANPIWFLIGGGVVSILYDKIRNKKDHFPEKPTD